MTSSLPLLSLVLPCHNEAGNIGPFVREILGVLNGMPDLAGAFEILVVDDASRDDTASEVCALMRDEPRVRLIRHERQAGQSRAVRTGVEAARSAWVCTLDGDGQSDPADLPRLLAAAWRGGRDANRLVQGQRRARAGGLKRVLASRVANGLRAFVLQDRTQDSACGFKIFPRAVHLHIPFFNGMHRFAPALHLAFGAELILLPIADRPRQHGVSKYNNLGRALAGIFDLLAVKWLISRQRDPGKIIDTSIH